MGRGKDHVLTKDSGTDHLRVNLWLTLYKLTGWLASLDTTRLYLSHPQPPNGVPRALFDVLVLDGGRGKTMNDLVDRDRELPANLTQLHKAKLHTDTHIHTYTDTDKELLIHHHHIFRKTSTAFSLSKLNMVTYQGGVHTVCEGIGIILLCFTNITASIHLNNSR